MRHIEPPQNAWSRHYHLGLGFHGFHRLSYLEWGNVETFSKLETLVCVHGLTRNAHDFDPLASALCDKYRVVCPDVVGRGESDHLSSAEGYNYLQYNSDMNALIARLGTTEVSWLGTSMGGIIGMVLASVPQTPIRRLIINDIGPEVPRAALESIEQYIGKAGEFDDLQSVETYLREVHHEFAPMSDEDWAHMTQTSTRTTNQGTFRLLVDNKVGDAFRDAMPLFNVDMWEAWEQISCPVLILRGAKSTFLTEETARNMLKRGPQATLIEFEDAGHAPTLRGEEQIGAIEDWLENH